LRKTIPLVKPYLPDKNKFDDFTNEIWKTSILSNRGPIHNRYLDSVKRYLKVDYAYPYVNGTVALETAIKILGIYGKEIITTPFTFVATTLAILNTGNIPVFCDVDEKGNIDHTKIKDLISENTGAILPVHVYGEPCNIKEIEKIVYDTDIYIIYDAAHAFGTEIENRGIGNFGDISIFSTHATKVFNTIEGGLMSFNNPEFYRIAHLACNFGLDENYDLVFPGSNGKMNEFQAAMGLLQLDEIDNIIEYRKKIVEFYKSKLSDDLIFTKFDTSNVKYSYSYFIIHHENRDKIHDELIRRGITTRKYFSPLTSDYKLLKNNREFKLDRARKISESILAIPLYYNLSIKDAEYIVKQLNKLV
jgi:dTDP-4-amino-4,6-dideoxygalactose transaminase